VDTKLEPGLTGRAQLTVTDSETAAHVGSGGVAALATPVMVGLMEAAAVNAVDHLLPDGMRSVGTYVEVRHVAPTPVGMRVTARAELVDVRGRTLTFRVVALDDREQVGEGSHRRAVVDEAQFYERVRAKAAGQ
jgi:predicted thioesterase